jgi:hypothetical protein
VLSESVDIPL